MASKNIIWFQDLGIKDVAEVGGKNASLGEMVTHLIKSGMRVPNGFATTASAFRQFLSANNLQQKINSLLKNLDIGNIELLEKIGAKIRQLIIAADFSQEFIADVSKAYLQLANKSEISVAVRSSATAEDLPDASFAGQQDTVLNVSGIENLFIAIKKVFASLYNDRAIAYRVHHGFKHEKVALSAGIQVMVRSDLGASGVMFSIDTESGFDQVVFINANYGLGETVVRGIVNPDEYYVYKPNIINKRPAVLLEKIGSKEEKMIYAKGEETTKIIATTAEERKSFALAKNELEELAKYAIAIEQHYKMPMDIEWAKDGNDGKLYIVQARPETVKSHEKHQLLKQYILKEQGKELVQGFAVGQKIGSGKARILASATEIDKIKENDVLVTDMTDPDWEPIMKKAAAIVTNRGGRTCHAAIVARELGIPAVVGTGQATNLINDGSEVTVSCAEGDIGVVYAGKLAYEVKETTVDQMPKLPVNIMMNIADPDQAFSFSFIPNAGVGLARLEFIINNMIGIHPNALLNFASLDADLKGKIQDRINGFNSPVDFYVEKLIQGIATIAAAFYPKPVIVRTSDFKTNEYANLLGGDLYEPIEENPMIGFRGASRYQHAMFKAAFALECRALKYVRDEMGLTNVEIMIPFVRTVKEMQGVLDVLAENGLKRGENALKVIMMCEVPSNAILAEDFLQLVDGFSIGSNDLTQLTLGLDRDSDIVANLFDERNAAVKFFLARAIMACKKLNKYIGICGQAPSDYPDLAAWLLEQGIASMSLNPDSIIRTWLYIGKNRSKTTIH